MSDKIDDKIFGYLKPDYTGKSAQKYIDKYTNRPEDAGNLKQFQKTLSDMGVASPPADMLNAAIYAVQGEWGKAGLSAAAVIPVLGDMYKAKKSGEKMITLYRGVDKWHPGQMVMDGKFVGGGKYVSMPADKKALWVTGDLDYAKFKSSDIILEFKVPESLVKSQLIKTGQINKKVSGYFKEGLQKEYLIKVHKSQVELSPLQKKLNKLKDNPNIAANIGNVMDDNIKRYNK